MSCKHIPFNPDLVTVYNGRATEGYIWPLDVDKNAVYKLHDFGHRTVPATEHSTMVGLCKPSNRS